MTNYNYYESMKEDVRDYLEGTDERDFDALYEEMWISDSVTGNGSGSYTFSSYKAEENLMGNYDLLKEAYSEFGCDYGELLEKGPEHADVSIRCYLLSQVLTEVLEELED